MSGICGERFVFWPEEECIDVQCELPEGHDGDHEDGGMEWNEDD
jgi:hypothetical protein